MGSGTEWGDVIVMLEVGTKNNFNHILLITEKTGNTIKNMSTRALGIVKVNMVMEYGYGEINISNPAGSLLDQRCEDQERGLEGEKNETFVEAKEAKILEVRKIKI